MREWGKMTNQSQQKMWGLLQVIGPWVLSVVLGITAGAFAAGQRVAATEQRIQALEVFVDENKHNSETLAELKTEIKSLSKNIDRMNTENRQDHSEMKAMMKH